MSFELIIEITMFKRSSSQLQINFFIIGETHVDTIAMLQQQEIQLFGRTL